MKWYLIALITIGIAVILLIASILFYKNFFKRFYDFILSLCSIIILSPLGIILTIIGFFAMKGNPFFIQERPGKIDKKNGKEKIFKLIKFRTMTNAKDKDGNLLPDKYRLNIYGKFLRSTSLDELPELINVFIGNISLVGPRPLLVKYLDLYNSEQRQRHVVRPGLTGYAQVHGRNAITWDERFRMDLFYVKNFSFWMDLKIILRTIFAVIARKDINSETSVTMEEFTGNK